MNKNFDSTLYVRIRVACFISASIVSALLNIILFSSLDPSGWKWILISMSLTLEGTKVACLTTRNVFLSLYSKIKRFQFKALAAKFMFYYLLLATLSVIAGLGFSILITSRTEALQTNDIKIIQTKITALQSLNQRKIAYETAKDVSLSEYIPYIQAQTALAEAQSAYDERNSLYLASYDEDTRQQAILKRTDTEDVDYKAIKQNADIARQTMRDNKVPLDTAKKTLDEAKATLQRMEMEYNEVKTNADGRLNEVNEEFKLMKSDLGFSSTVPSLAILELQEQLDKKNQEIIRNRGMAYMFDKFAELIHTTPETIKLCILLFVAILVELTIFQSSIDIRITRKVLWYFRDKIPSDIDVSQLLKDFDEEYDRFSDGYQLEEPKKEKLNILSSVFIPDLENHPEDGLPNVINEEIPPSTVDTSKIDIKKQRKQKVEEPLKELPKRMLYIEPEALKAIEQEPDRSTSEEEVKEIGIGQVIHVNNQYRFGKATESMMLRFKKFLEFYINDDNSIGNSDTAAAQAGINSRLKDIFIKKLGYLTKQIDGKNIPLISKEGKLNFSKEEVINYTIEKIS